MTTCGGARLRAASKGICSSSIRYICNELISCSINTETCELVPAAPRKNRSVLAKAKLAMAASSSTTTTGGHYMFLVALSLLSFAAYGQLSEQFYAAKCPSLDQIIKAEVDRTLSVDRRMGASLLRLFFHDCFVQVFFYLIILLLL